MAKNFSLNKFSSAKGFWLSFLLSGAAVPLGPIAATAQIQDSSTPEVALDGSTLQENAPDAALAAAKIEIPQLETIAPETNSAVDRTLADTDTATATVDRTLAETDTAWVDRTLPGTDTAPVDRTLPQEDRKSQRSQQQPHK